MRKSGGIIALIAGVLSLMAATFTLIVGGVGANFNAEAGDTMILLGWGGLIVSFAIIVLGAIAMNAKTFMPGLLIIIASIFGAIYGGTLVAVLMILALVGGVLACMSNGNTEMIEASIQEPKSKMDSLIVVVALAGLILMGILYAAKPNEKAAETPVDISIPDDTQLIPDTPVAEAVELQTGGVPVEAEAAENQMDEALPSTNATEMLTNDSEIKPETALPATADNQVIDMAFNDLYLDYNNLVGKTVKVNGYLMVFGEICSLSESKNLTAVLYTDTSRLSRENRKLILDNCASGCNVEIEGVVGNVQFLKGITATNLYKIITK
jgi:hypothetical protein